MLGRIAVPVGLLAACGGAGRASVDANAAPGPDAAIAAPDARSTVPSDPIPYTKDTPFQVGDDWAFVPDAYDDSHHTPSKLLVWLHGCGGYSSGDIWMVSPRGAQSWISLAVGGEEGSCWDVDNDPARVLASIDALETHFNIARERVVIGGYSSGGDLTYRTAFYHAERFAGALVENSSPFRDTGSSMADSLAAASWKFNVVHLAHLQDDTYPIDGVRTETDAMTAAGFPMRRIEVDGGHWDDPGAIENGHAVPGTAADLQTYLLPELDAGWTAP